MPQHGVDANGFRFHTKLSDNKEAEKRARDVNLEGASKAIILNFSGHKGDGDDAYIEVDGKKMKVKDVSVWLDKLDTNGDGIITKDELKNGGGDKLGLLKLDASKEEQQNLSKDVQDEQFLGSVKGMQIGLKQNALTWKIAKPIMVKSMSKQQVIDVLNNPATKNYIEKNIKTDANAKAHFREVMEGLGFKEDEIKKYGF